MNNDIILLFKTLAILCSCLIILYFIINYKDEEMSTLDIYKISFIGFISNLLDTLGVGSFSLIISLSNLLKVLPDNIKLIGTMNIQAILISLTQMLIFLHYIPVDSNLLLHAIISIVLGGLISGYLAVNIPRIYVTRLMLLMFSITGILLLMLQFNLIHILSANYNNLGIVNKWLFVLFMFIAGTLPAFGVGYYSIVISSIFLFHIDPKMAFPIITSASIFQMPITSYMFIKRGLFYGKGVIALMISGLVGVVIGVTFIKNLNYTFFRWLLIVIVIYNIYVLSKKFLKG